MKRLQMSTAEVARYWNENADVWSDQVRKGIDLFREYLNNPAFLEFIGDITGKRVLDAGCGEGYNTRLLAKRGARLTGVDIASRMIEWALREEKRDPLGIDYQVASMSDLSLFADGAFDVIVSTMAVMDTPDYEGAIVEFQRVLRSGGELFFSITHPCFVTKGLSWLIDKQTDSAKLTVSQYFDQQAYVEHRRCSKCPDPDNTPPFAVPCFPRTLSDYVNSLMQAGFRLKAIHEPRPSQEICEKYPWLQRWRDHAAIFLYVHATKP